MSITINKNRCSGCRQCSEVCPGNLIKIGENQKAYIKYPKDCWGCTSCLKECKFGAIKFFLGADIGGQGSFIHTEEDGTTLRWMIERADGTVETIEVDKKNSNQY